MEPAALHILIVDNSPEDRLTLRQLLTRASPDTYTITEADCGDLALAACQRSPLDCILLDYRIPDMDGKSVLAALRDRSDVPVVVLTGVGTEAMAVDLLPYAAQDYVVKAALTSERLGLMIQHAIASVRLTRERDQSLALLTTVLATLPVGVMLLDADLHIQRSNPALLAVLGQPTAALHGQALPQFWPGLALELAAPCAQVLRGVPFSEREIALPATADHAARCLAVSGTPLHDPNGTSLLILLTVQDITERKRERDDIALRQQVTMLDHTEQDLQAAYAELETQASRLNSLITHAPVGIALLDMTLRFQHINTSLAEMNRRSPEAHLGCTIAEVLPALASIVESIYHQVIATGEPILNLEINDRVLNMPGAYRLRS